MNHKLFFMLIVILLVFSIGWKPSSLLEKVIEQGTTETTEELTEEAIEELPEVPVEEGNWLQTNTSFDPLFKDVYSAAQGISTARSMLSEVYTTSREIAQLHGLKKEYTDEEVLQALGTRRSQLTKEQLSYFTGALMSLGPATMQAKTSLEACQRLQPQVEEAIQKAPAELASQPWKIPQVITGLKESSAQLITSSREGAMLIKELALVTSLLERITGQKEVQ